MDLDGVMDEALRNGPGAVAIACADVRAGFVLGASAVGDAEREEASDAATRVAQLCAAPSGGGEASPELLLDWMKRVAGGLEAAR